MAETEANSQEQVPGPQPTTEQPPARDAAPPPPSPGPTVTQEDLARYRRYEQQVKGFAPLYQAMSELGIRSREDIEAIAPILRGMRERGIDPRSYAGVYGRYSDREPQPRADGNEHEDIERLIDSRLNSFRRDLAMKEHTNAVRDEVTALDRLVNEVAGADAPEWQKRLLTAYAKHQYQEMRDFYPEGHPLAGQLLRPIGQEGLQKLRDAITEQLGHIRGGVVADIAKAAAKSSTTTPTPGGNTTPQGPGQGGRSGEQSLADYVDSVIRSTVTLP